MEMTRNARRQMCSAVPVYKIPCGRVIRKQTNLGLDFSTRQQDNPIDTRIAACEEK